MPIAVGAPIDVADFASWANWTPTLTNLTLGSGTQTAKYRMINDTIDWYWLFVYGSGSAVGTDPSLTLPVQPAAFYPTGAATVASFPINARLLAHTGSQRMGDAWRTGTSTLQLFFWNATPSGAQITSTAPWTWAAGDMFLAWGTYVHV